MSSRRSKSALFEYCQKRRIGPPFFETWAAANGYQSKVMIDGYPYPTSGVFTKKKDAEHDAAKACLESMGIHDHEIGQEGYGEYNNPQRSTEGYSVGAHNGPSGFPTPNSGPFPRRGSSGPFEHSNFATPSPRPFDRPRSGGSSGSAVKMPKSVLHEYCQSRKMMLPQYETEATYDGNVVMGFHCTLVVNDEYFTTDRLHNNKREAEHAAARKALNMFGYYSTSPAYRGNTTPTSSQGAPSFKTPETSYKNLLQEHLQQRNIETPSYETQLTDGGYFSKVTVEGKVIPAENCCQTKKQAEQSAAKAGLIAVGVKDPETVAKRLLGRNSRGQFRSPGNVPYTKSLDELSEQGSKSTWVNSRKQSGFDIDDYDDIDGEFVDFQKASPVNFKRSRDESAEGGGFSAELGQQPLKMQRVGEASEPLSQPVMEKRPRRRGEYEVESAHLGNLSVGEVWPEKRNIVIVGSEETSVPLVCQGDTERCVLEDITAGTLVDILPGHRLIGLEGYYVVRGGQIVLKANQCKQVVMPEVPDRVLISCGVVVLHCIPRRDGSETSCDVNVLLKRYLCSQAFINVVRGLAQYFRNRTSGRPFTLNKNMIVAHIQDWMLEEVMAISSFSETALENVFQHTMKYDKRWNRFLRYEEMSKELKEVQEAANQELYRRANSDEDQNQERFRPWRLPKGNFFHRVLTTGVFIESPAEAAMRELKEETGIKLKLADVSSSPYVDVAQSDNLNPHKGDVARYYLCGIITEAESSDSDVEELTEESADALGTDLVSPDTYSATTGTYSTTPSTDLTSVDRCSTTQGTYSGATSTYPDSTNTYPDSTNTYPDSTNTYPGSTGTYPGTYLDSANTYSGSTDTYPGSTGTYPGQTDTYPGSTGTYPDTTSTYSGQSGTYPGQTNTYPGQTNTYPGQTNTYQGQTNTSPGQTNTYPGQTNMYPDQTNTHQGQTNTHPGHTNTHPGPTNTHPGPTNTYSEQTNTYPGQTGPYPGSTSTYPDQTDAYPGTYSAATSTFSSSAGAYSATLDTDLASADTQPAPPGTNITSTNTQPAPPGTDSTSVKNESSEESNVIRSPFVAGAVHEECKWFDIEEARETSSIFNDIHQSPQFQKLIAKLKAIVSTM